LIEQGLALGRNGKAIWQDLVSNQGFTGGYQAVKRFVRKLQPRLPEAAGIILTVMGEETTAVVRWCATRPAASIAGHGCSC
jgi:hypothetical protein